MSYSLTSAANPKALLAAIITFATAQGWTIEYDKSTGVGTGVGGQIALSSDGCHIAIGEASAAENPVAVVGALGADTDGRLYMALANSINTASWQFWGHPGSLVTSAVDTDRVTINDVWGAMDEVHFFGNADYILVNIKTDAQRWTSFGFGNLDRKGMSIDACGFCYSNYHGWWRTDNSGVFNNAALTGVNGYMGGSPLNMDGAVCSIRIPDGVLDTSFGFLSGDLFAMRIPTSAVRHTLLGAAYSGNYPEASLSVNQNTYLMDQAVHLRNQPTTGGVQLNVLPIIYLDATVKLTTFLGEIPALRVCRMSNLAPGQVITYGSDDYAVFPWKQKGTVQDAGFLGGTYNNQPNSFDMGYAFRKD